MKTTKRHHPARGPRGHRAPSSPAAGDPPAASKSPKRRPWNAGVRTGLLAVAIAGTAVIATVGTVGSWPSLVAASEPTAMDKLADLKHLGVGVDGLLAAGLSVSQASAVLNWVGTDRQRFDAIRVAQTQVRLAQQDLDAIRSKMVRVGRTSDLDMQYATAETQLASAQSTYDSLITDARSALGTLVSEDLQAGSDWTVLARVIDNRDRDVPTAYRVLELSPSEWEQLALYHENVDNRPEALDEGAIALGESLALNSDVLNAQARIDAGVGPLVQALLAE
ncbi:MAG: hypothetical protein ACIAQF_06910 [Phycisphaerales bacterium JB065]